MHVLALYSGVSFCPSPSPSPSPSVIPSASASASRVVDVKDRGKPSMAEESAPDEEEDFLGVGGSSAMM